MGFPALLTFRRKPCYGLLSPLKVHRPLPGLNPQILGTVANTITSLGWLGMAKLLVWNGISNCEIDLTHTHRGFWLDHLVQTSRSENLFGSFGIFQFCLKMTFKRIVVKLPFVADIKSSPFGLGTVACECDSSLPVRRKSSLRSVPWRSSYNSRIWKWLAYHIHHFAETVFFTPPYEYDVCLEDTVHEIKSDDSRFSYFSLHFSEFSLLPFIFYFLSRLWQNRTEREIRKIFPVFFRTDEWKADPSYEHTLIIMGWSAESLSVFINFRVSHFGTVKLIHTWSVK
jgi:hypothetical protein